MMKKVLMTATVPSMIGQFNMDNLRLLKEEGYEVHIACNFHDRSTWTGERIKTFVSDMKAMGVKCHNVCFTRSFLKINEHIRSYRQLCRLFGKHNFEFVHCHTPIAGVITRMAAHKYNTGAVYTAHGFHFYKGASLLNWLIFYPIELFFSKWTDVLVTITKEDYKRAKKNFFAKSIRYVPGIGVDLKKFRKTPADREKMREVFGLSDSDIMLVSVGELNENKNHSAVIRAMSELDSNVHYFIAGTGHLEENLLELIRECGCSDRVHLLGYRTDVPDILCAADLYILPSLREGLNVSLMEAMASGLPCVCGNIRGNTDLISNGVGGQLCDCTDENSIAEAIKSVLASDRSEMGKNNRIKVRKFSKEVVSEKMSRIYTFV